MVIELDRHEDSRGFFARTFCRDEFAAAGLVDRLRAGQPLLQPRQGTVRGMHFQKAPHGEVKLVRAVRARSGTSSSTCAPTRPRYLKWEGFDLSDANGRTLYVPVGFAHGFQTLEPTRPTSPTTSPTATPRASRAALRCDDPLFAIPWPLPLAAISDKDAAWPLADPAAGIQI